MTEEITVTITTPTEREVVVTRDFAAPAALVFDALTKPELIKRWYGPPNALEVCESDPRPGGTWRFVSNVRGKSIVQFGIYKEVDAPRRFVRTESWEDWDPGETFVTVDLVERHGTTTMTQSIVFPTQEVRDVVLKGGLTPKGTSEFYGRLEELLGSIA
ncbi:MAG TPA: SRPBCC domain-containing protein [Vicinamibacterales bacterium]|nr:SRPBCC domain-containing protein [Vicinamibacterales bacterium]